MKNKIWTTGVLIVALLSLQCAVGPSEEGTVSFRDRNIDIGGLYEAFPYNAYAIHMNDDGTRLFYTRNGETADLMMLDLNRSSDLDDGICICREDFSKKNLWLLRENRKDRFLYWTGDEKNDEIINLYRYDMESGEKVRLTDVPYIYGWSFTEDHGQIAYVSRLGQNEKRLDELHLLDLATMEDRLVYTDQEDFRMTWSEIAVSPDGKGAVLNVLKDADRTYTNVAYLDFEKKELKIITHPSRPGSHDGTEPILPWYDGNRVCFHSDQDGYANVYMFDRTTGRTRKVTRYPFDINARWIDTPEGRFLAAVANSPKGSRLMIIDPETGEETASASYEENILLKTASDGTIYLQAGAIDLVYEIWAVRYSEGRLLPPERKVRLSEEKRKRMVHSSAERLEIPAFDIDGKTGKRRMLHAYLLTPDRPLKEKIVMIQSFYGGENSYDMEHQIFTDAGIYILSPSPRGSSGFGREYAAMNDKDLGGNEIIDIISCARYVSEKLNVPPERIGVFGMSHGGYATMRLMTFPGEVNGNRARFPFGFGVAVAGFCDILYQHEHSNIPDWTSLEAGDPVTDREKLIDRSPITHADCITGPLLLIHGNHDDRVDIGGSRMMYEKLESLGKPVRFLEIDGQGHGFKGIENNILYYKTILNFIDETVK